MLSRIAEALFWIGRYVERAEDMARIVDVHNRLLVEHASLDEDRAGAALLAVMGIGNGPSSTSLRGVTEVLVYDDSSPASIAGALRAARENARGVREALSSELWECLNVTWHLSEEHRTATSMFRPNSYLNVVKERGSLFAGLADSTMSRDQGWRFLSLGRSLERVDMTIRLLTAGWSEAVGPAGWTATLRCFSAYEAYLRTYRRAVDPSRAAEFLLLDPLFPRSVFHALRSAEDHWANLGAEDSGAGPGDFARRALGRARTQLEFCTRDDLAARFPEILSLLQAACLEASRAVAARYFQQSEVVGWRS